MNINAAQDAIVVCYWLMNEGYHIQKHRVTTGQHLISS